MSHARFFNKKNPITNYNGPTKEQQVTAIYEDKYWTVLNTNLLNTQLIINDKKLCYQVNAFKHALQTFGHLPPNFTIKNNEGQKVKGKIWHIHFKLDKSEYILEWTVIDKTKRIIALVDFASHENYPFKQKALTDVEKNRILADKDNIEIMQNAEDHIKKTKAKHNRRLSST